MGTHSSAINSLASSATHDLYASWTGRTRSGPSAQGRAAVLRGLGTTLILGALFFHYLAGGSDTPVVVLALSIASVTYGALLGTYLLAAKWPRATGRDVVAAVLVTVSIMLVVIFAKRLASYDALRLARAGGTACMAVVCAAGDAACRSARVWRRAIFMRLADPAAVLIRIVRSSDRMPLLIGADVGGSKTAVGVSDGGEVLSRAEGPGAAVRPGRALASASIIAEVVRRALAQQGKLAGDLLVVGAAGAGRDPEREELRKALRGEGIADRVVVTTDIEIALAGAFEHGPGIVVSAGTGSIAVGRDRNGRRHRIGGYGWQMGDEGSGYGIGRAALGAVSRAHDGRSPATALTSRVFDGRPGRGLRCTGPLGRQRVTRRDRDAGAARARGRREGRSPGARHRRLRRPRALPARHLPASGDGSGSAGRRRLDRRDSSPAASRSAGACSPG